MIENGNLDNLDPRRCADIEYISMWGGGITCICGNFWWDCGPIDESGEITTKEYKNICCTASGKIERIGMNIIKHTAKRGCCCWKPCFEEVL
jgi:hypothetical protein